MDRKELSKEKEEEEEAEGPCSEYMGIKKNQQFKLPSSPGNQLNPKA